MSALPTDPKSLPSSEACRLWVKAQGLDGLGLALGLVAELGRLASLAQP